MSRMDVCSPRQGKDGKTYWTRIGTFWPAKDGKPGGTITFDALPLTDAEGRCSVSLFEPKAREDAAPKGYTPRQKPARDDDPDESIPF
jgi:hypothetical protein